MQRSLTKSIVTLFAVAIVTLVALLFAVFLPADSTPAYAAGTRTASTAGDLAIAMVSAGEGDTVQLSADITFDLTDSGFVSGLYPGATVNGNLYLANDGPMAAHDQTLDLNGHTLTIKTGNEECCIQISGMDLKITSSLPGGEIVGMSSGSLASVTGSGSISVSEVLVRNLDESGGDTNTDAAISADSGSTVTIGANVSYDIGSGAAFVSGVTPSGSAQQVEVVTTATELATELEEGGNVLLGADITSNESLFFERDVTLDMNGYELTVAKATTHPVVIDGANVTIVDGNITVGKGVYANRNAILVTNRATLTLGTKSDETVVEDDGVFVTTNSGYGIVVSGGATLNMYGGSVTAKWCALGTNNTTGTAAFNVYGATLESTDDSAIFMSCYTEVALKNTTVKGKTAIDIRIGKLTVEGGSITSTRESYHEMTYTEATATGTMTGGDGSAILVKANYYYDNANKSNEVSISISSETTITGAVTIYDLDGVGNMLDGKENVTDQTVNLQTFVDELKTSHASVETHLYDVAPADGSGDGTIVDVDKVHADAGEQVTAIVSSSDELRAAFAEDYDTVKLGADLEISGNRIEIGDISDTNAAARSITLDLNGHKLTIGTIDNPSTAALYLGYNVSLTLTDTAGNGSIDASNADDLTVPVGAMRSGSTLTVESGTIIVDTDRESCVFAMGGGKIVIKGGTFINNCTSDYAYGGGKPLTVNIANNSASTIDISGGTFKGRNPMSGDDNTDVAFVSQDSKVVEYKDGNMTVVGKDTEVTGEDIVAVYTYADNEAGDTVATVYTEDTLRAALAEDNYDTVKLGADIQYISKVFVIDRPVTLDLADNILSTTSGYVLEITSSNVTVTGSVLSGEHTNTNTQIRGTRGIHIDGTGVADGIGNIRIENIRIFTSSVYSINIESADNVTVDGVEILSRNVAIQAWKGSENVVVEDSDIIITGENNNAVELLSNSSMTVIDSKITATEYGGAGIHIGSDDDEPAENINARLTIAGDTTISAHAYGIVGNGTQHGTYIEITDNAVITCTNFAVYHPQKGELKISGNAQITGASGIEMRAGTLIVTGTPTVTATDETYDESPLNDGPRFAGVALGVSRYFAGSENGVTLDISGGTFVAQDKGYAFYEKDVSVPEAEDNTSLSFAGATFNGDLYSENETGFIKSGTFSKGVDLAYVADGQQVGVKSDGGMEVADEISGEGYDAIYSVSSDDSAPTTATVYTEDALNDAVNAGVNVVLGGDIKANVVIPEGKTVTLDLNGHTLTNSSNHTIINYGTLTITDGSADKNGTVDNVTHGRGALVNYGVATLSGGTFTRSKEASISSSDGNGNSWYTLKNYGEMTIDEGVTVTTGSPETSTGEYSSLISNGFQSKSDYNSQKDKVTTTNVAKLTINGGKFSGGLNTVKNDEVYSDDDQVLSSTLVITGGEFTNTAQHVILNYGDAKISGGTFDAPSASAAIWNVASAGDASYSKTLGKADITGGTFNGGTYGIVGMSGAQITVSGNTSVKGEYAVVLNGNTTKAELNGGTYDGALFEQYADTLSVSSGTFSQVFDPEYLAEGSALYVTTEGSGYTAAATASKPDNASVVAAVMDGKGYASITEAIAAINDTEQHTITLVDFDGSNDETVTGGGVFLGAGDKNIVIDFNGLTYNVNTLVGSSGTESQLFHLEKGNTVTLKNGKIGVDEAVSKDVGMFIQNYSYLTLDGMTVDSSAYNDVNYTVSNNNGSLTVTGDTTIKAADGKVAFDVWYGMYESYYDGVTVTFDEGFTGTVIGKVEYGAATATSEWMEKTKIEFNSPDGVFDIDIDMSKNVPDATDANINVESGTFSKGVDLAYVADGQKVGVKPGGGMEVADEISGEGFDAIYTVSGDENASMSAIVYTADMFKKALDNDSVTEITLGKDFGGSYTIDRDVTIKAADGVTFSGNIVIESSSVTRTTGANVTIEGVAFKGNGSGTAISVKNGSLTMTGGSITDYDNGIVAGTRGGAAVDISVDNVTFTELDEKGIYGEAFGKFTVSGSTFNGAGNDASGAGNPYTGRSAAAIDINQTVAGGSVSITGNTFVDCGDNGSTSGAIKIKVRNIPVEQSYGQAGDFAAEHNELVGSFESVSVTNNTFTNCSRDIVVGTGYVADTYVEVVLGEGENANTSYVSSADDATTRDLIFVDNAHVNDAESLMNAFADEDLVLIEVFANITTTDIIVVDKPGKSVVLDLNGYTITANDTTTSTENGVSIGAGFLYLADGTLTVKDGTVNAIEDSFRVQTEATDDYAKLILADDLTVTSQNANAVYIRALNQQKSTTPNAVLETAADLKVSGKYAAIQGNGTSTDGPVSVTVTGGDIVADPADETIDGTGLYLPGRGEYLITGGTITAPTGVEFRAGTLTITGGTITATGEFAADPNGNGATTSGVAVAMMQHTTERDLTLNITGGEFNGAYAVYQQNIQNNDSGTLTMSLTGGTFNGNVDSENCTEYISGGQYSVKPAAEAFKPGFDGVEYDGYYVVIETTTDDIAALLAARIDAQADVRTYAAVLGIDWKAMEALADTDDVAAAALDAYNAIGNATSEGYVAIARSAAMDALDAYAAAMAESDALASAITDAQKEVREYAAARGYAWADIADTAVLDAYNAIASVQAVDGVDDAKADAISAVREYLDGLESSGAESELEAAKLKAQTTVKMYIASADIGGWTNLLLIKQDGVEVEKKAVAPIFAMYDMIEESTTVAEIDSCMWNAISQVDTYVNALETWRKTAANEVTAAAQKTAENDAVVVPTSVYAAINGAVNYTEVNAYKTNALAEIADIRAYRADIAEQGSELGLIYCTLTKFKNAFDVLDASLTGENNAFDTLLKDVQDAITTAQNAITGGTDESSESLASIKSYLENTIYKAMTDFKEDVDTAFGDLGSDLATYGNVLIALRDALVGDGTDGSVGKIDEILADIADAQSDITNIKTTVGSLATTEDLTTAVTDIKGALTVSEGKITSAITAAQNAITSKIGDLTTLLEGYGDTLTAINATLNGDDTTDSLLDSITAAIDGMDLASGADVNAVLTEVNKVPGLITAAQNAITSAIASVRTDIDALETALAGYESDFEGLSGTLAQINSSLGGKIDAAQADIDAIKTAIDALGTPASAAAVTELATAIDELKAAVDEISVSVSAPSAVETVKTEATADIAEWLNAYVDEIVNSVTASNGKAYAAAVTFAPALETTDGDLYAKLLKAFDKDNADLVLKYYNDALTAIDAATTADEVNTAVATFKAQVASVEAASGNTSDLTVVYVLLIVVLVVLVVAVVVAAVLSRKRRVPVGYAPAPAPAPAPATSETTEQTEKAAPAEKPEVTDDTAATAVEPEEAPDEDAGERVVINASVKTFDEAYDEMSDTLKDMFEKVREYALSKNGATGVRIGNGVRVKRGSKQIVKLTVRRGYPVAMFVLENEMLKDYRRTAGSSAKLKVPATELVLREPSDLDAAYMMVDLAVRQLDADVEAAKERRRELLRERRRQRREAMEAAKAAQAAQAEATTEQAEPTATEQNEAATPEQAVDEDKTE